MYLHMNINAFNYIFKENISVCNIFKLRYVCTILTNKNSFKSSNVRRVNEIGIGIELPSLNAI